MHSVQHHVTLNIATAHFLETQHITKRCHMTVI